MLQSPKPACLEPVLLSRRHCSEKPELRNKKQPLPRCSWRKPTAMKTQHSQRQKQFDMSLCHLDCSCKKKANALPPHPSCGIRFPDLAPPPSAPMHTDTQIHKPTHTHLSHTHPPHACMYITHTSSHTDAMQPVGGEDWLDLLFLPSLRGCGDTKLFWTLLTPAKV